MKTTTLVTILIFIGCGILNPGKVSSLSTPNEPIDINEYEIVSELIEVNNDMYYVGRKPKNIDDYNDLNQIVFDLFKLDAQSEELERITRFSTEEMRMREWRPIEIISETIELKNFNNKLYIYNKAQGRCCRANIFIYNIDDNSLTNKKIGINKTQKARIFDSFIYDDYLYFMLYGSYQNENYYGNYIYRTDGMQWKKQKIGHKNKYKNIEAFNLIEGNPYLIYSNINSIFGIKDFIKFEKKINYEVKFIRYFEDIFSFNGHTLAVKINKLKEFSEEKWNKSIRKNLCVHEAHSDKLAIIQASNRLSWVSTLNGKDYYINTFKPDILNKYLSDVKRLNNKFGYCGNAELRPFQLGEAVGLKFDNSELNDYQNGKEILLFTLNGKKWRYWIDPETTDFIVKGDKVILPDSVKNINEFPSISTITKKAKKY